MVSADANLGSVAYCEEASFGTLGGSPAFLLLRLTGESLKNNTTAVTSKEITPTRDIADLIRTDLNADGDINFEFSYGQYDDFIQAALCANGTGWTTQSTVVSAITTFSFESKATAGTTYPKIKDSANGLGAIAVGDWIKISLTGGSYSGTEAAQNACFAKTMVDTSAGELQIAPVNAQSDLVTKAAGAGAAGTVTVKLASQITNGTKQRSFTIEKKYTDLTNEFAVFSGMMVDQWKLSVTSDGILTGSFSFVGKREQSGSATLDANATYGAAITNDVMNSIDNVIGILEADLYFQATKFDFNTKNNLRARKQIATLGAISVGLGSFEVSGAVTAYYSSKTTYDRLLNFTETNLAIVLRDAAGNAYAFDFPRVKFATGSRSLGAVNTDVLMELTFQAIRDQSEAISMRVARFVGT